jgi:hypothetical protein
MTLTTDPIVAQSTIIPFSGNYSRPHFAEIARDTQGNAVRLMEQLHFVMIAFRMNTEMIPEELRDAYHPYVSELKLEIHRLLSELDFILDHDDLKALWDSFPGGIPSLDSLQ